MAFLQSVSVAMLDTVCFFGISFMSVVLMVYDRQLIGVSLLAIDFLKMKFY